jgi:hypothetical protein
MRSPPWNDTENAAVIRLYFDMLQCALAPCSYNKAGMIRTYQFSDEGKHPEALSNRNRGSIEFKLMNVSAVHAALGSPVELTMHDHGYRALPNYQADLKVAMKAELERRDNALVREQLA